MAPSREKLARRRKYLPLIVLYPVSAGIAVASTSYVAKILNQPANSAPTSNNSPLAIPEATVQPSPSSTTTTISPTQLHEQEQLAQLTTQIAQLKTELNQITNGAPIASPFSPRAVGAEPPTPTLSTHSSPPPVAVKSAPPVSHATTGASSAVR